MVTSDRGLLPGITQNVKGGHHARDVYPLLYVMKCCVIVITSLSLSLSLSLSPCRLYYNPSLLREIFINLSTVMLSVESSVRDPILDFSKPVVIFPSVRNNCYPAGYHDNYSLYNSEKIL